MAGGPGIAPSLLTLARGSGEAAQVGVRAIAGDNGAAYLDRARADGFFARLKVKTIEAMLIQPGDRVVDVGCGTGEEVVAMSLAADDVSAIGFDLSERNIAEARRRHVNRHVEFVRADAHALPLQDASVDGCRAERTLQHVTSPGTVVAEIARILRPAGRVVLAEPDWPSGVRWRIGPNSWRRAEPLDDRPQQQPGSRSSPTRVAEPRWNRVRRSFVGIGRVQDRR